MNMNATYARDAHYAQTLLANANNDAQVVLDTLNKNGSLQAFLEYFGDFWNACTSYGGIIDETPSQWVVNNKDAIFSAFVR